MSKEYLDLKWGTLKGWLVESDASVAAMKEYFSDPVSASAAMQRDTPKQKAALLKLIDAIDGPITNDWTGEKMSKEQARDYVEEYDR